MVLEWERVGEVLKQYGVVMVLGAVGIGLVGYGLWGALAPAEPVVEIVESDEEEQVMEVVVDVAGAVEAPGVYRLQGDSRIGEAVSMAGGLASSADRNFVARYVNLASPVQDGMKIYIPAEGEGVQEGGEVVGVGEVVGAAAAQSLININTASVSQLDALWGIGEARANDIISNRPYGSVEELTSKAGIPSNVYEKIKEQVSVY